MFEITYLVFIRYRGPFGISIPLPRLRTAHLARPMRPLERFDVAKALLAKDNSGNLESINPLSPPVTTVPDSQTRRHQNATCV